MNGGGPDAGPGPDVEPELERLVALALDAVVAASDGRPVPEPGADPVARRVAHVVDAIAGAGDAPAPS